MRRIEPDHKKLINNPNAPKTFHVSQSKPKHRIFVPFNFNQSILSLFTNGFGIHTVMHLVASVRCEFINLSPC